jgi:hypothetical protein
VKQALPLDSADVLTAGQIEQWHTKGWLVLDNIWPSDAIAAAAAAAAEIYPKPTPGLDPPEGGASLSFSLFLNFSYRVHKTRSFAKTGLVRQA